MEVADAGLLMEHGDVGGGDAGTGHEMDAVGGEFPEGLQILDALGGGGNPELRLVQLSHEQEIHPFPSDRSPALLYILLHCFYLY